MNIAETEAVFTAGLEPASNAAQRARAIRLIRRKQAYPGRTGRDDLWQQCVRRPDQGTHGRLPGLPADSG